MAGQYGITGIVDIGGNGRPRWEELECMIDHLAKGRRHMRSVFLENGLGLGYADHVAREASGRQPAHSPSRDVWVLFSGELFNAEELRRQFFHANGAPPVSDAGLIAALYECIGDAFLERLNGQFALALWDRLGSRLLLARDPVGIGRLYYRNDGGRLLFASQIGSILAVESTTPRVDIETLYQLFAYGFALPGATLFDGIQELGPGEVLSLTGRRQVTSHYWEWRYPEAPDNYYPEVALDEQLDVLNGLHDDAVRMRRSRTVLEEDAAVAPQPPTGDDYELWYRIWMQESPVMCLQESDGDGRVVRQSHRGVEAVAGGEWLATVSPAYLSALKLLFADAAGRGDAEQRFRDALPEPFSRWAPINRHLFLAGKRLVDGRAITNGLSRKAASLDSYPFLDRQLLEHVHHLPPPAKRPEGAVHRWAVSRRKGPDSARSTRCSLPVPETISGRTVTYWLSEALLEEYGYFEPHRIRALMDSAQGKPERQRLLIGVVATQMWHCQFMERFPRSSRAEADGDFQFDTTVFARRSATGADNRVGR